MRSTAEACELLLRLERDNDVNAVKLGEIALWPLIRYCLWVALLDVGGSRVPAPASRYRSWATHLRRRVSSFVRRALKGRAIGRWELPGVEALFVSRGGYLQRLEGSGLYFDRIIDPLMLAARHHAVVAKLYVGALPVGQKLFLPGRSLRPTVRTPECVNETSIAFVRSVAMQADLSPEDMEARLKCALASFREWYETGLALFRSTPKLKRMYVTCWYFPDIMGLTAAAKETGIAVTDVQHGKQGKYQGMYSWWSRLPSNGYRMMPDRFWCWGQPSCDDILAVSPDRATHRPFVGGYPWIEWYRTYLGPARAGTSPGKIILFTLQGPQATNDEPVPDFIVDFLKDARYSDWRIRIRNHPNFPGGLEYCAHRFSTVDPRRFEFSSGVRNLYDELQECSHHMTAYSSCGYEAEAFGVPTMLFGEEARRIYEADIRSGRFAWTAGVTEEMGAWLTKDRADAVGAKLSPYMESSLAWAAGVLVSDLGSACGEVGFQQRAG